MIRSLIFPLLLGLMPIASFGQEPVRQGDGVYVAAYRTSGHVRYSDPNTFNLMVDDILMLLEEGRVIIRKDPDRSMIRTEEAMSASSLLNIARLSGANSLLQIVVNRPFTKWIEVTLKCYDMNEQLLWEEKTSEGGGWGGKNAPAKTLDKLRKLLEPHIGKPGLPVSAGPVAAK